MKARFIRRPLTELVSEPNHSLQYLNIPSSKRHESTYKRTKRALNIGPHQSFLPSRNSPQKGTHIIFNPPSSAASVYHTPLKFLPKSDPRLKLFSSITSRPSTARLPPPVDKKHGLPLTHLSESDMREIQRLRMQDPVKWTTHKLAKKFGCTSLFVTVLSKAIAKEKENNRYMWETEKNRKEKVLQAISARWGDRRRIAREDKAKRRELILRDE